ncbi:MAG: hypothetical protein PVF70_09960 [Anaerolineales bacterium]|jgi:hypothetical protein
MRTPAGTECPYYFADFHRGRQKQECRLIDRTPGGGQWQPELCSKCRVPRIVMANACPDMVLEARAVRGFLGLGRRVEVSAYCLRTAEPVSEPEVGCGLCHLPWPDSENPQEKA